MFEDVPRWETLLMSPCPLKVKSKKCTMGRVVSAAVRVQLNLPCGAEPPRAHGDHHLRESHPKWKKLSVANATLN
jgi:hypothetical protein